ncbi:hypothetical protein LR69_01777 [Geobacillus sp. BCO2]|nr:hypothetical protein LR69_01777 [Geobacillus sp. BCO2]
MIDGASRIGLTMSSAVSPPAKPAEAQKQFAALFKEALNA